MPDRPEPASLRLVVYLDDVVRRVIPLTDRELTIGRGAENDLVLEDGKVSRAHCRITSEQGRFWIEDRQSVNGTRVNGRETERCSLARADQIEIGPFRLLLEEAPPGGAEMPEGPTKEIARQDSIQPAGPRAQELAVLLSLVESLESELPRPALLDRVLDAVLQALDGERAYVYHYRSKGTALARAHERLRSSADPKLPVSERLLRGVVASRQPALLTDLVGELSAESPSLVRLGQGLVQSVVVAPLLLGRKLTGVLYVDGRIGRRSFSTGDLDLLRRTSAYLAGVMSVWQQQDQLAQENDKLRRIVQEHGPRQVPLERLLAPGSPFSASLELLGRASQSDVSVLITGETGTGKEEAARFIHRRSPRAQGPFIAINCGAIPESLVESELFGAQKGAFSGANEDRAGQVELAHGGTLFLDEIGELPPAVQVRLLRVLEEKQVQRLGASAPVDVDFRLLAATHRDLAAAVRQNTFRQDLLFRIAVFPVQLPALRERMGDLALMVGYLVDALAPRIGRPALPAAPEFLSALEGYDWPGNIRELRNVLERALVLEDGPVLSPTSLPLELLRAARETKPRGAPPSIVPTSTGPGVRTYADEIRDFERDYFRRLRQQVGTNISAMARVSGISRFTLYRKLGDIGLDES